MLIKTKLDILEEYTTKAAKLADLAKRMEIPSSELEKILEWLEEENVIEMYYLPIPFTKPAVKVSALPHKERMIPPIRRKIVESYEYESEDGSLYIRAYIFYNKEGDLEYFLDHPELSPITEAYIKKLKDEISLHLPAETYLMTEEEREKKIYSKQFELSLKHLVKITKTKKEALLLAGKISTEMYGVGTLEYFLVDPNLEEIVINTASSSIYVYHRKYGWLKTNIKVDSEAAITNMATRIARRVGKQITVLNPLLDAHLIKGERVNATLYPISVRGNTLTIRKFSEEPFTMPFLIQNGTLSSKMAALLWQAQELEMNVLVVGGTASGKTTMLNAILMLSNPYRRIITIEDTREIVLPPVFDNWVPLITRSPNPEGLGEVSLLDLMVNSLRMRPDKIIVGEVRRKEEALVMFEAMHTGHSVYSTFHADTAYIALKRLQEEPIDLPAQELDIVDLIVTQRRNRRTGQRRTFEIGTVELREKGATVNKIFTYRTRLDRFDFNGIPIKYREKLSFYAGMTEGEMKEDLEEKEEILKYLIKKRKTSMDSISKFIKLYYRDREEVVESVRKGKRLDI